MAARSTPRSAKKNAPESAQKDDSGAVKKGLGREVHLVVRLTRAEKRRVEDAAALVHLRISDWVRQVVLTTLDAKRR